ncbi:MAG: transcriptional repressor [Actinomycetaceae bacterium]|nr:transcriptional repressor [Actinomycetaceae bacterium]
MAARTRNTAQRQTITEHLERLSTFVSAQKLHESLTSSGSRIGLATVYRTLQVLADEGAVDLLRTDSEVLYRYCGLSGHHHHLVCRSCGTTVEVSGSQIETWARRVARDAGFVDVEHTVELMGTCSNCA